MPDSYERFVAAYLRLNGYFTVPNFIVHAGNDPGRVSHGLVGNYTETDILGVRMSHSREVTGGLCIANHALLVGGSSSTHDLVIAEVKSGSDNRPNAVWRKGDISSISYIVRFVGLHCEEDITAVATALATRFRFEDKWCRFRYVVFAPKANDHYRGKGVTYITLREAIQFIVEARGQCWTNANLGVASCHHQWDDILTEVFKIANQVTTSQDDRVEGILAFLAT